MSEGDKMNVDSPQSQNASLQRLQNVEKWIVRVLELAGGVMDELANPAGPRKELIDSHCREFMKLIKIQKVVFDSATGSFVGSVEFSCLQYGIWKYAFALLPKNNFPSSLKDIARVSFDQKINADVVNYCLETKTNTVVCVMIHHLGAVRRSEMDIHYMLRDEIKSACEYRPFEKCDYSARLSSEISHQKLECVIALVDKMKETIDQYQVSVSE